MAIFNKENKPRSYYVVKSVENGKFMRRYIRSFTATDIDNAEIFRDRGSAAKALSETVDKNGIIVKMEVNLIE